MNAPHFRCEGVAMNRSPFADIDGNKPDVPMSPGDEAASGSTGTGEDLCQECRGSGKLDSGSVCSNCEGTGYVIEGIGGG
jgi:hypothetical protein